VELENEEERLGYLKRKLSAYLFYYPFSWLASRSAIKNADHVLVGARTEIAFFEKYYGMTAGKYFCPQWSESGTILSRRDYEHPHKKLLYVGGWEWRKGIRYLIEAFTRVAEKSPDVTLTLSGMAESDWGYSSQLS